MTDSLISATQDAKEGNEQFWDRITSRTLDLVMSFGKQLSCALLSSYMKSVGLNTLIIDADYLGVDWGSIWIMYIKGNSSYPLWKYWTWAEPGTASGTAKADMTLVDSSAWIEFYRASGWYYYSGNRSCHCGVRQGLQYLSDSLYHSLLTISPLKKCEKSWFSPQPFRWMGISASISLTLSWMIYCYRIKLCGLFLCYIPNF